MDKCSFGCLSLIQKLNSSLFNWMIHGKCKEESDEEAWEEKPNICYDKIRSRISSPSDLQLFSNRQIYDYLCNRPIHIDGINKKLWIDKESMKAVMLISPKALFIAWGDDNRYWNWVPRNDSSFGEVARLVRACWFEVKMSFDCELLSQDTEYTISFRVKFESQRGWEKNPVKFLISSSWGERQESARLLSNMTIVLGKEVREDSWYRVGEDGWIEVDAGHCIVPKSATSRDEIEVSMRQLEMFWKSGILVDSVKVHPRKSLTGHAQLKP